MTIQISLTLALLLLVIYIVVLEYAVCCFVTPENAKEQDCLLVPVVFSLWEMFTMNNTHGFPC